MRTLALAALAAAAVQGVDAQDPKEMISDHVLANASEYGELAAQIWSLAEVGYQEYDSTRLLRSLLGDRDPPLDYRSNSGN